MMDKLLRMFCAATVAVVLAGCGGGGSGQPDADARGPDVTAPPTNPPRQTLHVTPSADLVDRQRVVVRAEGFTPGARLVLVQCADMGAATGPADCDMAGMAQVTADASGIVQADFTAVKGPFARDVVCSATQRCLVSVAEMTSNPTEAASAPISFR